MIILELFILTRMECIYENNIDITFFLLFLYFNKLFMCKDTKKKNQYSDNTIPDVELYRTVKIIQSS